MKALMSHAPGAPDSLVLEDVAPPQPAEGEIVIRVAACGVNFPDVLMVAGEYQFKPDLPFIPGMEAAGDVIEVGSDVHGVSVGERVIVKLRNGAFAERVAVTPEHLAPLPSNFDGTTATVRLPSSREAAGTGMPEETAA